MLNQRKQILQIAVVSIMCLVLAGGAQGVPPHYTTFDGSGFVFEFEDAFPVPDRLHIAQVQSLPSYAGTFDTEIVALSLKSSSPYPLPLMSLPGGTYAVDSFFDVFTELTMSSGPDTIVARLSDPDGIIQMVIPPEPMNPPGALRSIQIEIVSMELTGDVGGIPITIRVSPSPSLQSTGETTIRELGDGTFQIDSFFDVFTELSVQGGPFVPQSNLEPMRLELTPVRLGQFEVAVAGNGDSWNEEPDESGNNDGWVNPDTQRRWINYPQDPDDALVDPRGNVEQGPFGVSWWNEWWWNDKYDRERVKMINLSFDYKLIDPTIPGFINVAINWSTTDWSLNPPPGIDPTGPLGQPPLSDFDPSTPGVPWVGRWKLKEEEDIPAEIANPLLTFETGNILLPVPYNPEWVSIDVRGYNFTIEGGQFSHECIPDPDLPPTFEQLDWVGLTTSTPDSTWGRVTLPYNLPPAIYYFNLSIGGAAAPTRVVHNLSFESPGGDQKLMAYFNLGVTDGTDVSSLDYGYSISNVPVAADPPVTSTASVPDLEFQIGSEGGIDLGSPSPPQKNTSNSAVNVADPSNSGVLADKDKFVNQPQGKNQCAPGAISNSLKYLQATGKIPAAIPTGIGAVGTVVGTTATGTPQSWYLKKKTHYKKHINTRWIDAPLTVAKVQELVRELKDGQDIEMDLDGHVEVLAGIRLKADGTVDLDLYDDNQKDKKSDPMHTSPLMTDGTDDYVDGMKLQRFVIECPKEPATATTCTPYFSLNTADEWLVTLEGGSEHTSIKPITLPEWGEYMGLWNNLELLEDPTLPYPENEFLPSLPHEGLYVYEGDGDPDIEFPDDGGLVMGWGTPDMPLTEGQDYASAFKVEYGVDPDLSNCIITVAVTAPVGIAQVSLGLETPPSGSGNIRSWYWNCGVGPGFPIQSGVPTTITIDTSIAGTTAATPTATNFVDATGPVPLPLFDITNVQWILVDENGTWMGAPATAPTPGGTPVFMWNYWHWLMVSPKTTLTKALLTKHAQGPIIIDTSTGDDPAVPLFWGWDEVSDYHVGPIAADDWECKDNRPVTDFHWWGSFPGWTDVSPPCHPVAFHIGIWTDTPAVAGDPESYSHPKELVWEHICDNYVWNFAGYDRDPRQFDKNDPVGGIAGGTNIPGDDPAYEPNDACFQYNQLLDGDDWFYQEPMDDGTPRTYWLSIAPIWDYDCDHEWGWKTRPKFYMDNAVSITAVSDTTGVTTWPPVLGNLWSAGVPLQIPAYNPLFPNSHSDAISWDLAFEISTNETVYEDDPKPGDVNADGKIDLVDVSIVAADFLWELVPGL